MLLNLAKIINMPGEKVPFNLTMDFSELDFGGSCSASEPAEIQGQVVNEAGVLLLNASIRTKLHCVCDRCATPFERDYDQTVSAVIADGVANEESEDDDWTFLLQNDSVDLDDVMTTGFVLNMDQKTLCREDCKGLCPQCGKNLNEGPCGCVKEVDPRLAVLAQLLKDKE